MSGNDEPTKTQAWATVVVAVVALLMLAACCTSPWWGMVLLAWLGQQ